MNPESCPFKENHHYRILRDYSHLNHAFHLGDHLIFTGFGYSAKEGITRYWFKNTESGETNAWHVFDSKEKESDWRQVFEEI